MIVEKFQKTLDGPTYYCVLYRSGRVVVSITDIKERNRESALIAARRYLQKALKELEEEL